MTEGKQVYDVRVHRTVIEEMMIGVEASSPEAAAAAVAGMEKARGDAGWCRASVGDPDVAEAALRPGQRDPRTGRWVYPQPSD